MTAKTLMIVGSSSSAGKSLLVTALCRIFARRGVKVAPFKAQNMSNNAAVCPDGCEIGRAQAVQAAAAGLVPTAEMNPILLKPEADAHSQVIVLGHPWDSCSASAYYHHKQQLWPRVTASLDHLREMYELVIIEGAGSPVEMNLKAGDIVNLPVALYARSPLLLVGDIDRGGIFAQLLGTTWLLEPEERALLQGYIVNKFRGDPSLFEDGIRILEGKGKVPVLGVVPYLHHLGIPEEDAVALDQPAGAHLAGRQIEIAILRLPHIANFDDFDPLANEPGVQVRYVHTPAEWGHPDAVILPGTKSTIADLLWLEETGLSALICAAAGQGKAVVGICGGYQMLGQSISDPEQIEANIPQIKGLGLLPHTTCFQPQKETHLVQAKINAATSWLAEISSGPIHGYEIHMGVTCGNTPWIKILERGSANVEVADGAISPDGRIWGCYLHGLFENETLRHAWLKFLGWQPESISTGAATHELAFDRLADAVENALNLPLLESIIQQPL
jgi:adenosylcobyric acid synthase